MSDLYRAPLRVYLIFACLLGAGLWAGSTLPISLFPMSSRPEVTVSVSYVSLTPQEFIRSFGSRLEGQLQALSFDGHEVERVRADYGRATVRYAILFQWGTPAREAERETQILVNSLSATFPQEVRDTINVWNSEENSGFFALNFFSAQRSPDQLYEYLEPLLAPRFTKVPDAQFVELWNPRTQEARIQLRPDRMAVYQLLPKDIQSALSPALRSYNGGRVYLGTDKIDVVLPRQVTRLADLEKIVVTAPGGHSILLRDIADIELTEPTERRRIIRTNGQQSLMVYAQPRPGGNIKRMSEDILSIVRDVGRTLPSDIQYQPLVDPSVFIRSAIRNVLHEVALAAGLAVLVLFGFIGNIKNVITAAIEIPISMILAFILMKWAGVNLNLISLAGLALSAGMNVDGSVVVMENIFRHFAMNPGRDLSFMDRVRIVSRAVSEVRIAILATTVASLVVFLPLAMTSGLTNALLGDLAKAVVFSHGISAFVALILVPVIRLHILRKGPVDEGHPPLERPLRWLEARYQTALRRFLESRRLQLGVLTAAILSLAVSLTVLLPRLPKEIIGNPDTDWVGLSIRSPELTQSAQMDSLASEIEGKVLDIFGDRLLYTFTQVHQQNSATVMWRLKDKRLMEAVLKEAENHFQSTPAVQMNAWPWNPSELPIPNPPQLRVEIRGAKVESVLDVAADLQDLIRTSQLYQGVHSPLKLGRQEAILFQTDWQQMAQLQRAGSRVTAWDVADLTRLATVGTKVGTIQERERPIDAVLRFPEDRVRNLEDLESLPVGVNGQIIPLKALARPEIREGEPLVYNENGRLVGLLEAYTKREERGELQTRFAEISRQVQVRMDQKKWSDQGVSVEVTDAQSELDQALRQLLLAIALSVFLIFLTMVIQFGDIPSAVLILVPIPLGLIGVFLSLWLFRSTLSLNSALGIILLNGLAVGNSIILVDFFQRGMERGLAPLDAALEAARTRLRPILMTSMTTALGMLPIALGLGEGGKILQPLGLSVIGGLGISVVLTLFFVPALQVVYWTPRQRASSFSSANGFAFLLLACAGFSGLGLLATPETSQAEAREEILPASFEIVLGQFAESHPDVRRRKAELEGQKSRSLSSALRFLPSISGQIGENELMPEYSRTRRMGLDGSLNLFRFGADWAERNRQLAREAEMEAIVDAAILMAEAEVGSLLLTELELRRRRAILDQFLMNDRRLMEVARLRFERGLLPKEEVQKLELDIANRSARMNDIDLEIEQLRVRADGLGLDRSLADWPWVGARAQERFARGLKGTGDISARPDVRAERARNLQMEEAVTSTHRLRWPSLDLVASTSSQQLRGTSTVFNGFVGWSWGLRLSVPLFDGLTDYATYREAVARRVSQSVELEIVERTAASEIEHTRARWKLAEQGMVQRESALVTAQAIYRSSQKRFEMGRIAVNDLSVDQNRVNDSELLLLQGRLQFHRAAIAALHARGARVSKVEPPKSAAVGKP